VFGKECAQVALDEMDERVDRRVVEAWNLFSPKWWKSRPSSQRELMLRLLNKYSATYDIELAGGEVMHVKAKVSLSTAEAQFVTFRKLMKAKPASVSAYHAAISIIHHEGTTLSEWRKLASIHQVLPYVSVDAERVFSVLRGVKTDLRNQLGEEGQHAHLNLAVRGMHEKKPVGAWDYDALVQIYLDAKPRRITKPRSIIKCIRKKEGDQEEKASLEEGARCCGVL
jgi:hypothetical protein